MTNQLLALCAVSLVGCATDATTTTPAAAPSEMTPVATFASRSGTTIEVYPVGEHGYMATEIGDATQEHVLTAVDVAHSTSGELYQLVTERTDVPAALATLDRSLAPVDASQVVERRGTRNATPVPQAAASGGSCSAAFFTANGGCPTGATRTWCLLDWWNGAYEYTNQTDLSFASICADKGSVLWQIQNGDGGFHQISVLQGQWFNYSLHDGGQTWLHYDVLQASGDRFQFGGDMWSY
jgi:hypothetical protein